MKILHLNTSDLQGGAARAAYRLHQALLVEGADSHVLVNFKSSSDYTVITREKKRIKAYSKIISTLDQFSVGFYKKRTKTLFSQAFVPSFGLVNHINQLNPDIVHLHWINGGMLRIEELSKINAPIVWSLHDMWAFTGGCHYDEDCGAYQKSCGNCKVLGSTRSNDLSKKIFRRKQKVFFQIQNKLTIIGLSQWMKECAEQSTLFKDIPIITLPNPINIDSFFPINKNLAREMFNLPQGKKLILFGAMNATDDPRKGFYELKKSFDNIPSDVELIVFGSSEPKVSQNFKQTVHYIGSLHDDISLKLLYSATDVMVVPSIQENLSNAIMESLACGTPVVSFSIGGNADMIEHKINGYLATPYDSTDLARGIKWVVNADNYNEIANNARQKVLNNFSSNVVAKQYIELYKTVLYGNC